MPDSSITAGSLQPDPVAYNVPGTLSLVGPAGRRTYNLEGYQSRRVVVVWTRCYGGRRRRIPGFSGLSRGSAEERPVFRLRQPEDGRGLRVEGQATCWKLEVKPAFVVATRKSLSRVSSPTR